MATAPAVVVENIPLPRALPKPREIHFLTTWERLFDAVIGCRNHKWGFPVAVASLKKLYPRPYNCHQACTSCGRMRMFNSQTMEPGPTFERVSK